MGITAAETKNIEIGRSLIIALNEWDFSKLELLFTADATLEMPFAPEPIPRRMSGRDTLVSFFKTLPAAWDSANFHDIVVDTIGGDANRLVATYKSDTIVKVNGRRYQNQYVTFFTIVGDQVSYMGEHYDPIQAIIATGGEVQPIAIPH
jgi:ketosteroid isomerase-like protein